VEDVWRRVKANHYKRTMPNIARLSNRALGHDFLYLRDWVGQAGSRLALTPNPFPQLNGKRDMQ
ncbi:MAG: hypothetical protein J4G17_11635, partial [Anaerolineae bacterium]|nr:hypothetical protein [Anaerolineae bacterium]